MVPLWTPPAPLLGVCFHYPLPGLVFQEWLDERVQRMNVPGLIDKMDSSEASRKAVLGGKKDTAVSTSSRGSGPAAPRPATPGFSLTKALAGHGERKATH